MPMISPWVEMKMVQKKRVEYLNTEHQKQSKATTTIFLQGKEPNISKVGPFRVAYQDYQKCRINYSFQKRERLKLFLK